MGKEREAMSVVRTLTALCVLYAATSMAHESDVMTFGSIVKLKEWADSDLNLSGPVSDGSLSHGSAHPKTQSKATDDGVVSLGESDQNQVKTLNLDMLSGDDEEREIDRQMTNGDWNNDGDGDLGESNMVAQSAEQMAQAAKKATIVSAEHLMSLLALKVAQHQHAAREALEEAAHLGERNAVSPFEEEDPGAQQTLYTLLKPSGNKHMKAVADQVGELMDYLGSRMMQGEPLSKQELEDVRAFYLDNTARVLGEYAYDDSESLSDKSEIGRDSHDDEKQLADDVKEHMDQTDAVAHMDKMGVHADQDDEAAHDPEPCTKVCKAGCESSNDAHKPECHACATCHQNAMSSGGGKGGKGDSMGGKGDMMGGKGALFDKDQMGGKGGKGDQKAQGGNGDMMSMMGGKGGKGGDDMMSMMGGKGGKGMMGMMPGGKGMNGDVDPLMGGGPPHFDSIMQHLEEAGRLADFVDQVEESCQLGEESHDKTIEQLESKEGKITAGIEALLAKVKQGKLFAHDNDSAPHENSPTAQLRASLTEAVSKEDDAKIVQDAGALAEGQIKETLAAGMAIKPEEKKAEKLSPLPQLPTKLKPPDAVPEAIHIPVEHLRDHSVAALDQTLTNALKLYSKRHAQKKQLSVDEHKSLSAQLRQIAAHLMRKVQHSDGEAEKAKATPAPTEAVTQAIATPAPTEEAPAPVQVAAAPMVQGGAVKQFIWHVLGKNQPVSGPTAQPTLRGLLKQGVTLFNGGKMFFDVAKPAN